jgi:hypothetical protein
MWKAVIILKFKIDSLIFNDYNSSIELVLNFNIITAVTDRNLLPINSIINIVVFVRYLFDRASLIQII